MSSKILTWTVTPNGQGSLLMVKPGKEVLETVKPLLHQTGTITPEPMNSSGTTSYSYTDKSSACQSTITPSMTPTGAPRASSTVLFVPCTETHGETVYSPGPYVVSLPVETVSSKVEQHNEGKRARPPTTLSVLLPSSWSSIQLPSGFPELHVSTTFSVNEHHIATTTLHSERSVEVEVETPGGRLQGAMNMTTQQELKRNYTIQHN